MKNILLLVHDDEGQEARLQAALDLTRAIDGHLSCVDVALFPAIVGDPYGGGVAAGMLLEEEREREGKNKAALEARLAHEDVSWDWSDITGTFADSVCDAATLADIIVLNRRLDQFPYPDMRGVASRILTHARAPVLAVTDGLKELKLDRALIAWDGRTSVAATMRACVPVLKLAQAVEIFTVRRDSDDIPAIEAATYLSRHGIHPTVRAVENDRTPIDQHIAAAAESFRADYILMGAYGRGRLMEAFGGVTKRMLNDAKLPLILGH